MQINILVLLLILIILCFFYFRGLNKIALAALLAAIFILFLQNKENMTAAAPALSLTTPFIVEEAADSLDAAKVDGTQMPVSVMPHQERAAIGSLYRSPNPHSDNEYYSKCYPDSYLELNRCDLYGYRDTDEKLAAYGLAMEKNRRAIDGQVSKGVDFYSRYFDDEFAVSEKRQWWGANDV